MNQNANNIIASEWTVIASRAFSYSVIASKAKQSHHTSPIQIQHHKLSL